MNFNAPIEYAENLRRRLAAEDASYSAIVGDVRRKLAIEYLQMTRMSVDDVACKVGFSDSPNLRRAVRRWTGKTIRALRASTEFQTAGRTR